MICENCIGETKFITLEKYHYRESGLPNVFLLGIQAYECVECGEVMPIFPMAERLHEKIAEAVALKPHPLTGAEMRFLRKRLGLSAVKWAGYMRTTKETVSRWENEKTVIGGQSDALARLLYFRLLEETTETHFNEPIANQIADVDDDAGINFGFHIPTTDLNTASART